MSDGNKRCTNLECAQAPPTTSLDSDDGHGDKCERCLLPFHRLARSDKNEAEYNLRAH